MSDISSVLPSESEVGSMHDVFENFNGYLQYTSRRTVQYAGSGRWEVCPGSHTLWHEQGGAVYFWQANLAAQITKVRAEFAVVTAERDLQSDGHRACLRAATEYKAKFDASCSEMAMATVRIAELERALKIGDGWGDATVADWIALEEKKRTAETALQAVRERLKICFDQCQGLRRNGIEESDNYWELAEDLMSAFAEGTGQTVIRK